MRWQGHRLRRQGIALVTALLLTVILLIIGMGFLSASQRDLNFQRRQQVAVQAQFLAESGVEYFRYLANKTPPDPPEEWESSPSNPRVINVSPTERIEIEAVGPQQTFVSRGIVLKSNGDVAAQRTIVVYRDQLVNGGIKYDAEL